MTDANSLEFLELIEKRSSVFNRFDSRTMNRGREYFKRGRVRSCGVNANNAIVGLVNGTRQYVTKIQMTKDFASVETAKCNCPVEQNCKHAVALLFDYFNKLRLAVPGHPKAPLDVSLLQPEKKASVPSGTTPAAPTELKPAAPVELKPPVFAEIKSAAPVEVNPPVLAEIKSAASVEIKPAVIAHSARMNEAKIKPASAELTRALDRIVLRMKVPQKPQAESLELQPGKARSRNMIVYILGESQCNLVPSVSIAKAPLNREGKFESAQVQQLQWERLFFSRNLPAYVEDLDLELVSLWQTLSGANNFWSHSLNSPLYSDPDLFYIFLSRVLASGRCYFEKDASRALQLGPKLSAKLVWKRNPDQTQSVRMLAEDRESNIEHECFQWRLPWYIDSVNGICGPAELPYSAELLEDLLRLPSLDEDDALSLSLKLPELKLDGLLPLPECRRKIVVNKIKPVPHLSLVDKSKHGRQRMGVLLSFDYPGLGNGSSRGKFSSDGESIIQILPDIDAEAAFIKELEAYGFVRADEYPDYFVAGNEQSWIDFAEQIAAVLKQKKWQISSVVLDQIRPVELTDADLELAISEEKSWWFSLALHIIVNGKKQPLLPLLCAAIESLPDANQYSLSSIDCLNKRGKFYGVLQDSKVISLPFERVRPMLITVHEMLLQDKEIVRKELKMSALDAARLLENEFGNVRFRGKEKLKELLKSLKALMEVPEPDLPKSFNTVLRPYQLEGLAWLQLLARNEFAGILADDMGLGKTVQMLAFIAMEKEAGRLQGSPFLVVCPTSVLPNWLSEAGKFCPELKALAHYGFDRASRFSKIREAELVFTSYPLLVRDIEKLRKIKWRGIALDEAQAIKNPSTQLAEAVCSLTSELRFCMTGTPIENHLGELWSQFHFLLPGYLGDKRSFKLGFRDKIEKHGDTRRLELLATRVRPFILRRTKEEVANDLPEKTIIVKEIELEGGQRDLYETVRLASTEKVRQEIEKKGFKKSQIMILDALLKLRQVCCDPRLVKLSEARKVKESAKLDALLEMMSQLQDEGRRVLVFSQFTSMLDLISEELRKKDIDYVELRGDTTDRVSPVKSFQNEEVRVFLLSLKAGGSGLNLTAADTVIHYDPWWNPAVEAQASDRAHRIGQTKNVFIYKLLAKGSIEEKMIKLQKRKAELAAAIFTGDGNSNFNFTEDDIDLLLSPIGRL